MKKNVHSVVNRCCSVEDKNDPFCVSSCSLCSLPDRAVPLACPCARGSRGSLCRAERSGAVLVAEGQRGGAGGC
ncbi:hypothetical protein SRHO_G00101870 [Serrasalmus rhombeus]